MLRRSFMHVLTFALLFAAALATAPAAAQTPTFDYGPYRSGVPTPQQVLGYNAGEQFTPHHELERYLKTISDAAKDRMRLVAYGKTYEGRTLYYLIISSPENLARVEEIRAAAAKLADPRTTNPDEAAQIAKTNPAVAWLSYNVHGNESSSTEAAIQVIYQLAAGTDQRTMKLLSNLVIILDPLINPDGRERYVHFFRSSMGKEPNPDPASVEHQERWPGGRQNHYLFDLNRDWAWQSQIESQARIQHYLRWNPVVHVDYHEMGANSTYFFAPPAEPVHTAIAPLLAKWYDIYGKGNAAAFDRHGIRYFTREGFDIFYPSYGDSWPAFNGATGMTYEQAGHSAAGLVIDLGEKQGQLTLKQRAWQHFLTSLATLETTADNREARLRDLADFRRAAIAAGRQGPYQSLYLVPGRDREVIAGLVEMLQRNGVEVQRTTAAVSLSGARDASGREVSGQKQLPAGTYVVDTAQPSGILARALLEPEAKLPTPFFYDITAWSLPLAMGVEGYWEAKAPSVARERVTSVALPAGGVEAPSHIVAYLFPSDTLAAGRLAYRLLHEDINCHVATRAFKLGGRDYPAGTIIVPTSRNPQNLAERVRELAAAERVQVTGVSTGMSDDGTDLGSSRMRLLRKPKIAVVTDSPVSTTEYGALWFLLEQRLGMKFTAVRAENLRGLDLKDYSVLIFPPDFGQGRGWGRTVDRGVATRIAEWIRGGGLVIGLEGGGVLATQKRAGWTGVTYRYPRKSDDDARIAEERRQEQAQQPGGAQRPAAPPPQQKQDEKEKEAELERKLMPYAQREFEFRKESIPGAIMRLMVDTTHPLGFGLDKEIYILNTQNPIFDLAARDNVIHYPKENFHVSGYLTDEVAKKLPHTAHLVRQRVGGGHVVMFAGNAIFRGFWESGTKLLTNAILFGNVP